MRSYKDPVTERDVELTDLEFAKLHDETLGAWEAAKTALDAAKEKEMALRKLYVAIASDPDKTSGTQNVELNNGYKAKVVKKETFSFVKNADDKVDWDKVHQAQDEIEATGNEGAFIADRLFKWTAELSLSEYKKLESDNPSHVAIKAIADRVIVSKQGAPTLAIVAPKS